MPIGTVDSRYSTCRYSMAGSPEGATVSSQGCTKNPSHEGALLV